VPASSIEENWILDSMKHVSTPDKSQNGCISICLMFYLSDRNRRWQHLPEKDAITLHKIALSNIFSGVEDLTSLFLY
jgi:hypothetical protein